MKKFWIVLLAFGLIAAFCMPAAAVDVKVQGTYLVTGLYEKNRAVTDEAPSMAFYAQRLRMDPVFKVAEGLTMYARADIMTRVWGQTPVGSEASPSANGWTNTRNLVGEQNIQMKRVWVEFNTAIGLFKAGYRADGLWGTDFADNTTEGAQINFQTKLGPVLLVSTIEKVSEGRLGGLTADSVVTVQPGYTDSDIDKYCLGFIYAFPQGQAGFLYCNTRHAAARPEASTTSKGPTGEYKVQWNTFRPYFKAALGRFYAEGEFQYDTGEYKEWDNSGRDDIDYRGMQWYLMAKYSAGPGFVGFQYAHSDGDDPDTPDRWEAMLPSPGNVWQPTLILFNEWISRFAGNNGTYGTTTNRFTNADLYQIFAGFNPLPKLAVKASFTLAYADVKPRSGKLAVPIQDIPDPDSPQYVSDEFGKEFDLTATYKIYDNLEYMVGFAYLWTGDYFKGISNKNKIDDDYLLMHQLTLSF